MQTRRNFIKNIGMLLAVFPFFGIDKAFWINHIQPINVSANLDRQPMLELGRNKPYYEYLSPHKKRIRS